MKCLMIEMRDRRRFFTHEKNINQLIEFSKHFKARISLVEMKGGELLSLERLAPALCDTQSQRSRAECEVIEVKLDFRETKTRANPAAFKKSIRRTLISGRTFSIKSFMDRHCQVSRAAIYRWVNEVKKELRDDGHEIVKVSPGKMRIK